MKYDTGPSNSRHSAHLTCITVTNMESRMNLAPQWSVMYARIPIQHQSEYIHTVFSSQNEKH